MSNQKEHHESVTPAIAVVGVGALFPGSTDVRGFWRSIVEGRDQIKEIPQNYWLIEDYYDPDPTAPDKTYGKRGAFLDEVPFDAMAYGVPPTVVQQTDTSQLLGLIVAQQVLEDAAGDDFQHIDKSSISVILGTAGATELFVDMGSRLQRPIWLNALRANGIPEDEAQVICDHIADSYVPWTEASFPGLLGNVIAGRIANNFDLGGTNCVVDAACASSFSALSMGMGELYMRQANMVIVGGVDTLNNILMYMCFSKTPALSTSGDCRPFSDQADGTMLGEGLGMLALRRLEDAEGDGDRIYAVIRGLGASSDGKGTAVYAPKASGQAQALRRAYAVAGYSPRTVELLEAHGTATKAGDVAEFTGASSVFAEADPDGKQWCAIGSIKSQIGHTKGAAGAAALIKAVLALHHKVLPTTIKVDRPNPNLAIDESPFYINTQTRPWIRDVSHPRRVSVSSFGFGGSNFHVTLEEYTGNTGHKKDQFRPSPTELFLVSGANVQETVAGAQQLAAEFDSDDGFQFLARSSQLAFQTSHGLRMAVVAKDMGDLRTKLEAATTAMERDPTSTQHAPSGWFFSGDDALGHGGKLAFLFPGQGSQYVGMGADLALAFDKNRAVWDEAANLEFEQGGCLHEIVFPQPVFGDDGRAAQETRLRATEWAQPSIGVASLSLLALLSQLGITPDIVAGHSFGEVTALHCAGVFDRKVFLTVARKRGELMAEAATLYPGAMTAIFHNAEAVASMLADWKTGVVIANHNSPDQVVISGSESAIQATEERLRQAAIRFQRLPVLTAFHSAIVSPAAAPFRSFLDEVPVGKPLMPVYANSMAAAYSNMPDAIRETLAGQIAEPVRFAEQIETMYAAGVRTFVEVGPGAVLTNLVKSCLKDRPYQAVALDRKGQHGLTSLWQGLAQLAVAAVPLALEQLWEGVAYGDDPRRRSTPKLAVNISGVNYAKPYPPADGAAGLAAPNPPRNAKHPAVNNQQATADKMNSANDRSTNNTPAADASSEPHITQPVAPALASLTPPVPQQPAPSIAPSASTAPPKAAPPQVQAPVQPVSRYPAPVHPAKAEVASTSAAPATNASQALGWVNAMQTLQQQTADAHMAFLQVAEQSMRSLEAMLSLAAATHGVSPGPALIAPAAAEQPSATASGNSSTAYSAPIPGRAVEEHPAPAPSEAPVAPPVMAFSPDHANVVAAQRTPETTDNGASRSLHDNQLATDDTPSAPPAHDLHAVLMAVVSEKTGYPSEMLEPGMALDTDLGIDSIKRVEILAAMRERVPALPEFDTNVMAGLRTLGEIVAYMDGQLGQAPIAGPQQEPDRYVDEGTAEDVVPHPSSPPLTHDLHAVLMAVVSEKTGYPSEMLEPDMALDTDLGIDSIKRVEILAAMRERVPALPEFDTGVIAGLRTLGEIVAYMDGQLDQAPVAVQQQETARQRDERTAEDVVPHPSSPPLTHDLHAVLMAVVSEKTGYPSEMLEPGMALDYDLGIDSIKRVEILAAMRERVPALPEFDTSVMAGLRTLGEIVDYMGEQLGQASSTHENEVSSVQDQQPTPDSSLSDPIRRYVLEMSPKPAPGLAPPYLVDGTAVYITDDGSGIAAQLAEHLAQAGARTTVCTNVPVDARAVICLAGLGAVSDVEAALTANEDAFQIATTIAAGFEAEGGLFVTVQDTGGDLGLHTINGERAWLGGLSGLAKTAAQEWPKAVVRTIDLATAQLSPTVAAERLAAELLNGADDREIGLTSDGERYTFVSTEKEAAGGADTVTENSVIVVSGGGRGVTAAAAIELARTARPHIALLGRSVLEEEPVELQTIGDDAGLKKALLAVVQAKGQRLTPRDLGAATDRILAAREIRATLQALQSAGSEAIYLSCDITDSAATATALEQIRAKWGPITGIIHGAGVLADKRLAEKSGDDFRRVFGTKIGGLRSLLAATANDPLSVICLFSSVAARTGNAGQSDYAMANEVLNRVANDLAKQRKGCVVKSIGWGPWAGGMVTPILRAKFDEMGVPLIPLASGARHFVAELQQATAAEVEVIIGSVPQQAPLINLHQEHSAQPAIYDVVVSAATTPYLLSHQIEGVVVVPLVMVQEWFLRAANTLGDGLAYNTLRKLRVLKGIPLPAFADRPTSLRIRIESDPSDSATLNATLFDDVGVARFAAQIVHSLESQPAPMSGETLAAASIAGAEYYRSQLFHGPAFATLQTVDQLSENGAQADLAVSRNVGWPHDFWRSDPALIDGGLQLALVWAFATLKQLTLPTAIEAFVLHEPDLLAADRRVRCIIEGKPIGQSGARFDLWFVDAQNGANIAEIRGLETYVSSPPLLIGDAE